MVLFWGNTSNRPLLASENYKNSYRKVRPHLLSGIYLYFQMEPNRINKMNQKEKILNTDYEKQQSNYKCNFCGKSFTKLGVLHHIKTVHLVQNNHKCDFCGKSFSHQDLLGIHNKTFHQGLNDWKCDSCDNLFPTAILLKEHIHTVHFCHNNENCKKH